MPRQIAPSRTASRPVLFPALPAAPFLAVLLAAALFPISAAGAESVLITSWHGNAVHRYDAVTGELIERLDPPGLAQLSRAHSVRLGPDGLLYVSSFSGDKVSRFDPATGAFVDDFIGAGVEGLSAAADALHGPDGDLYVCSYDNDNVLRFDGQTGAFVSEFIPTGSGGLDQGELMEFGPNGNLYIASRTAGILEFDGATGDFVRVFIPVAPGALEDPHVIVFGWDGLAYVSSFETDEVRRYDGETGEFLDVFVTAGSGGLARAHAMAFGIDGNFYVTSFGNDRVLRYDGVSGEFLDVFIGLDEDAPDGPSHMLFVPVPELRLSSLEPGTVGSVSTIEAKGAAAGERVLFFRGRRAEPTPVPGCPDLDGLLAEPRLVRKVTADGAGTATLTGTVPPSFAGRTVLLQAIVKSSCRRSNVVKVRIP